MRCACHCVEVVIAGCINLPFAALCSDAMSCPVCCSFSPVMVSSHLPLPPSFHRRSAGTSDFATLHVSMRRAQESAIAALTGYIDLPSVSVTCDASPDIHQDSRCSDHPSIDVNLPVSTHPPLSPLSDDTVSWDSLLDHDLSVHHSCCDVTCAVMGNHEKLSVKVWGRPTCTQRLRLPTPTSY